MAKRSSTPTCCLTLPLKLEKWQEDRLAKRFEIARQLYNTLLNAELKKLRRLEQTPEYRENQAKIQALDWKISDDKPILRELYKVKDQLMKKAGFTEYGFKTDMKDYYKHFNDNIGSNVAIHGIAPQVWTAFEKVYFKGTGKKVHFKRFGDMYSLRGYSVAGKSGGVEIMYRGTYIEWKGLKLPLKLSSNNEYEAEMLSYRVKYVRILRKPGKSKDRWYAQLSLEGTPVIKHDQASGKPKHPIGHGAVGLDIGPQTLAYSSRSEVGLIELADKVQNIEQKKRLIQRKMDRSRRATNPNNYAPDGTIRRGVKLTRNKSKRYLKLQKELSYLQHTQAETRKRQHIELANHLLTLGDSFYVEDMDWAALSHKAKETAISEKTGKYKRKKRFGKSIANKAPATFISLLSQKCNTLGLAGVQKVSTMVRASQYNHISQTYEKKPLSQRWNNIPDGRRIQRDLYSAFLLEHMLPQQNGFDQAALEKDYAHFTELHDKVILQLISAPQTLASMGIRRTAS